MYNNVVCVTCEMYLFCFVLGFLRSFFFLSATFRLDKEKASIYWNRACRFCLQSQNIFQGVKKRRVEKEEKDGDEVFFFFGGETEKLALRSIGLALVLLLKFRWTQKYIDMRYLHSNN